MNIKLGLTIAGVAAAGAVLLITMSCQGRHSDQRAYDVVSPTRGDIRAAVSATGTVLPQNRLEIKPPIAGRIEEILVQEGDRVRIGQILANMSSTDRAALLDAAQPQGKDAVAYWNQVYKSTPILSPINGTVIVRSVEPGQTITSGDDVVVLSDRLIVQAQVDETDIGKVHQAQKAVITLDAYPNIHVDARVDHIAYESKVVNNVTTYEVDILPQQVPSVFRSGMSANVDVITAEKKDVLTLPVDAIQQGDAGAYVKIKTSEGDRPRRQPVVVGMADDKKVEITSGVGPDDKVLVERPDYSALDKATKTNPFMPSRPRGGGGAGAGGGGGRH